MNADPTTLPLGRLLQAMRQAFRAGNLDRSELLCQRILRMRPDHHYPLHMLGIIASERDDLGAAIGLFRKALSLRPNDPLLRLNLGLVFLKMGEFHRGWAEYEMRTKLVREKHSQQVHLPDLPFPRWKGEALGGKRFLLVREQGFGDQLQFVRYASLLAEQGASVDLLLRQPMARLLGTAPGVRHVHVETLPEGESWDYWSPMMSIPGFLGTVLETIPAMTSYLSVGSSERGRWEPILADYAKGRPRIGLAWAGNARHVRNNLRSIPFSYFADLARRHPECAFISVQIGKLEQEATEQCGQNPPLLFLGRDEAADFAETAAVMKGLDLVIGVDTSTPHLAGALGIPTWLLLHKGCDWRWLRHREDTPWYPGHRLFRQTKVMDWASVIERVSQSLSTLFAQA